MVLLIAVSGVELAPTPSGDETPSYLDPPFVSGEGRGKRGQTVRPGSGSGLNAPISKKAELGL